MNLDIAPDAREYIKRHGGQAIITPPRAGVG